MDIFQRLNEEHGLTIVIVTHEPDIARYVKRALEFRDGRLRTDVLIKDRLIASEVLPTLPLLDDEGLEVIAAGKPASPPAAPQPPTTSHD